MKEIQKGVSVDKVYKLKGTSFPLSYTIPSRNTKRYPLLWFDEKNNVNRPLRYAVNQKTPFEDEQDGNFILNPIIFENGFLTVPRNNPVLQQFLYYHPLNGSTFVEVDSEKDASEVVEGLILEADALSEARKLTIYQVETIARILFNSDVTRLTTSELRRDVMVYAKRDPNGFMSAINDPGLQLKSTVRMFFDNKLLVLKNNNKDVYMNTSANKKRLVSIPYGEDPLMFTAGYLQSDEGLETYKLLESLLKQ